jgi:2-desacetyl-2-hydroxyethyl bacteriochlorophyllide A dehydrogenase
MRAAFCTGPRDLEIRNLPPLVPGPGEVVVRVHSCGICGSDLHYYCGQAAPPPVSLGHEISGQVAAVGSDGDFATGDPVVVEPLISCGGCSFCRSGEPNLCPTLLILGNMAHGGFAEAVLVPASSVYRLPAGLDLDTAVLTEPLAVAVHATRVGTIGVGDHVLVLGAGAIGLLAAFAAAASGARVTVSARHPQQRSAAHALGAAAVIGSDRQDVLAGTGGSAPDVVIEAVGGTAPTLDLALEVVRPGGRIIVLGFFTQEIRMHPLRFLMKEVHLTSSMTYSRSGPRPDFARALGLLARNRDLLASLITHRVSLSEIAHGFALAADKSSGAIKVAVTI